MMQNIWVSFNSFARKERRLRIYIRNITRSFRPAWRWVEPLRTGSDANAIRAGGFIYALWRVQRGNETQWRSYKAGANPLLFNHQCLFDLRQTLSLSRFFASFRFTSSIIFSANWVPAHRVQQSQMKRTKLNMSGQTFLMNPQLFSSCAQSHVSVFGLFYFLQFSNNSHELLSIGNVKSFHKLQGAEAMIESQSIAQLISTFDSPMSSCTIRQCIRPHIFNGLQTVLAAKHEPSSPDFSHQPDNMWPSAFIQDIGS